MQAPSHIISRSLFLPPNPHCRRNHTLISPPERAPARPPAPQGTPAAHRLRPFRETKRMQYKVENISFPACGFRSYFAAISGCFSSFPQGTCSLSVSSTVFSLLGCASQIFGIHFQVYLLASTGVDPRAAATGLSPYLAVLSKTFAATLKPSSRAKPHICADVTPHIQAGLVAFQSPLLSESLLFSFPPLTNMLKFSRLPALA